MSCIEFLCPPFLLNTYLYDCDEFLLALAIQKYLGNEAKIVGVYAKEGKRIDLYRRVFVKYRGKCIDVMGIYEDEHAFFARTQPQVISNENGGILFNFDTNAMEMDYTQPIVQETLFANHYTRELSEEYLAIESTNMLLMIGEIQQLQFVFQLIQPKLRLLLE
jgi:hypothetical protein